MGNSMNELELNITVQQKVSNVCQRIMEMGEDKVGFIILYGSSVKGKMAGLSDVDVAVFYKTIREYEDFKPHLDLYYSGLEV